MVGYLDTSDELALELLNGIADPRAHKECVALREDAEHLVGVPRSAELVAETRRDFVLNAIDATVVLLLRGLKGLKPYTATV